jgi:hypothetical protein
MLGAGICASFVDSRAALSELETLPLALPETVFPVCCVEPAACPAA